MRCRECGEFATQPLGTPKARMRIHTAAVLWHLHETRRALEEQGRAILVGLASRIIRDVETLGQRVLEDTSH